MLEVVGRDRDPVLVVRRVNEDFGSDPMLPQVIEVVAEEGEGEDAERTLTNHKPGNTQEINWHPGPVI